MRCLVEPRAARIGAATVRERSLAFRTHRSLTVAALIGPISITGAGIRRRWETLLHPLLPKRLVARDSFRCSVSIQVEAPGQNDPAAHGEGVDDGNTGRGFLEEEKLAWMQTFADLVHDPGERRHTCGCTKRLSRGRVGETEGAGQRVPNFVQGFGGNGHHSKGRAGPAGKMSEIQPQNVEEAGPAAFSAFELLVPVVRTGEKAVDHADDAGPAVTRFDDPLGGERRSAWAHAALGGKAVGRLPGSDG